MQPGSSSSRPPNFLITFYNHIDGIDDYFTEVSSKQWPPCIRVIVKESDCLDAGSLFIITCSGTTIGREKDMNHGIRIPDLNVSKVLQKCC